MRLFFINYEFPPIGGGGGRATWEITRRLVKRGHDVLVMTSHFGDLPRSETLEGVRVERIRVRRARADRCPPGELISFMRRSIPEARRLAAEFRPEAACAFFGIPGGPAAWRLKASHGVPYVLSLRGSDVPRRELADYQRLHLLTRPFLKWMWSEASALIAVSEPLKQAVLAISPGLEVEVVPNGIDLGKFRLSGPRRTFGTTPTLLFVGRLQAFKGVQHVLQALPQMERRHGGTLRLLIVGDGPYRAELELLAQKVRAGGAKSEIVFVGWLDQDDLLPVYESAAVLVLPSYAEGHPNVLLEAMAMGVPCAASDVPGPREVLTPGKEGELFPPGDAAAVAGAVMRILGDEETWRALSRNARARAEQYAWADVAARYETILLRAAGGEA